MSGRLISIIVISSSEINLLYDKSKISKMYSSSSSSPLLLNDLIAAIIKSNVKKGSVVFYIMSLYIR